MEDNLRAIGQEPDPPHALRLLPPRRQRPSNRPATEPRHEVAPLHSITSSARTRIEDRLPQLAADLVGRRMAVIVASGGIGAALAAKAATLTIPIVFMGGADPVKYGLVATLNRPGGNITGVTSILNELAGKRLELLLELVPKATTVGHLVANQSDETQRDLTSDLLAAARALGQQVIVLECRGDSDFEAAFATRVERQPSALVVSAFPLAFNNRAKILALGGALQNSRDISATPIRLGRRSDELRPGGHPSSNRILFCPPDSQGRQAC